MLALYGAKSVLFQLLSKIICHVSNVHIYIYICDPFLGFLFWATSLRVYPYTVKTECLHFCHFVMSLVTSQGLSPSHPLSSMCIELWASKYTLELICQLYSCTHHTHPPDTHMSFKILMQLS